MTLPGVTTQELNGAIGALPAGVKPLVYLGVSDTGPVATPAAYGRTEDIASTFIAGPLVDDTAYAVRTYGRPVIMVRAETNTDGSFPDGTAVEFSGTGTSVPTVAAAPLPNNTYEIYVKVVAGGTVGVTGITYRYSIDGGRTLSPVTALNTDNSIVIPGTGGVTLELAAGTLVAGDTMAFETRAPNFDATSLGAALAALKQSALPWDLLVISGPLDGTLVDTVNAAFADMPEKAWLGQARIPDPGETEAEYLTAIGTALNNKVTDYGAICVGDARISDGLDFKPKKRSILQAVAPRIGSVLEHVDVAQIDLGSLPGVSIRDANGNPVHHDEAVNPGFDDLNFITLRTWDGVAGVYITNPRLKSAAGSDFRYVQHRRVLNLAKRALRLYMQRRLSKDIQVDQATGFILETEALEIEHGADAAVRAVLMDQPKASGGAYAQGKFVQISRTDNVLVTETITGQLGVVPLGYPKFVALKAGFVNPANLIQAT